MPPSQTPGSAPRAIHPEPTELNFFKKFKLFFMFDSIFVNRLTNIVGHIRYIYMQYEYIVIIYIYI
jgi:hypothetical protein